MKKIMKKILWLFIIVVIIFILYCGSIFVYVVFNSSEPGGNGKLENKVLKAIKDSCIDGNCEIDLSTITPFKWSKFYVFEPIPREHVEQIILQLYPYTTGDIERRLIFLDSNNNIVYYENIFPNVESLVNNQVVFSTDDTAYYNLFTKPKFRVTKKKIKQGYYYNLYQ